MRGEPEQELLDFIKNVIERFNDIKRDGYDWIDAVADELSYWDYEVQKKQEVVKGE